MCVLPEDSVTVQDSFHFIGLFLCVWFENKGPTLTYEISSSAHK